MKIICIGMNYKAHVEELNFKHSEKPIFFLKPDSAILKSNKDFYLPEWSKDIEYETEIVFRINRLGKYIQKKFAHRYYDAVGIGLDLTARDLQNECRKNGMPWEISKGFDGSAVISEFTPIEEFSDINNIDFCLEKNGKIVQQGNSSEMIFKIDEIIEHISKYMTLKIGDLIFTGTPLGVGPLVIGDNLIAKINGQEAINMKVK